LIISQKLNQTSTTSKDKLQDGKLDKNQLSEASKMRSTANFAKEDTQESKKVNADQISPFISKT